MQSFHQNQPGDKYIYLNDWVTNAALQVNNLVSELYVAKRIEPPDVVGVVRPRTGLKSFAGHTLQGVES